MDDAAMPPAAVKPPNIVRRCLHIAGSLLALAGVLFVGFRLRAYWLLIDVPRITWADWSAIVLLAVGYGAANFLLALAWWHLLKHLGAAESRSGAIKIYGISNLAKYVPGNIFHLAGRQALGMSTGISAGILSMSMLWELGLIALGGAVLSLNVLPQLFSGFTHHAGMLLSLFSASLIATGLAKLAGRQAMLAFLLQLLFLLFSSVVFVVLILMFNKPGGIGARYFLPIGGAYIAAWLIGLVTPGAPAGVGVREMILLFLLKAIVPGESLIVGILFGRLVTVAGDLVFFLGCSCLPSKSTLNIK